MRGAWRKGARGRKHVETRKSARTPEGNCSFMISRYMFKYPNADGTPMPPAGYDAMLGTDFYRNRINEIVDRWQRHGYPNSNKSPVLKQGAFLLAEFRRFCAFHNIDFDDMLQRDVKLALGCGIIALQRGE